MLDDHTMKWAKVK